MRALSGRLLLCLLSTPASAHGGHEHADGLLRWTLDPWIILPLTILALLFALGRHRLSSRMARGRPRLRRQTLLFVAGWSTLALALVSPLHAAGGRSFFLHMIEHEILMLVATPLLVLAEPLPILLWAFPQTVRRRLGTFGATIAASGLWKTVSGSVGSTMIQAGVLWLWHAPTLFNRALQSDGWHIAQHVSFILSALLFWTAMFGRRGNRASVAETRALAAVCLFVTSLVGGALGALMAMSESPWYAAYAQMGEAPFGLTPGEDQQLAGLVMWLPGGMVHALAALVVMGTLLRSRRMSTDAV